MDKLIQSCFSSIIYHVAGDKSLAKEYEHLAMEEYKEHEDTIKAIFENKHKEHKDKKHKDKYIYRVEDIIPRKVKKRLYEIVS